MSAPIMYLDLGSMCMCMNYNITVFILVNFVMDTNRETIHYIYSQNLPRIRVNELQNTKTDIIIN